jgi:hypothetical protein
MEDPAGTTKLPFRKLNSVLCEQVGLTPRAVDLSFKTTRDDHIAGLACGTPAASARRSGRIVNESRTGTASSTVRNCRNDPVTIDGAGLLVTSSALWATLLSDTIIICPPAMWMINSLVPARSVLPLVSKLAPVLRPPTEPHRRFARSPAGCRSPDPAERGRLSPQHCHRNRGRAGWP